MAVLIQRPIKGSRISTFYPVKALPPLSSLDSAFQLQEYISLLIRLDVHDVETIVSLPGRQSSKDFDISDDSRGDEKENDKDGRNDVVVDTDCWVYEQLRRLAQDLSHPLITMLQLECTRATCPEMKAGEWLYLCVAHGTEGAMEQCCAIDYILHTLDSATALLNSPRAFPSRLSVPPTSRRHFSSLARRLGRIFAHAYFHHREAFEQAEAESSLYARFLALTSKFNLVPSEFLVIPPRLHDDSHDRNLDSRDSNAEIDPLRFLGPDSQGNRENENRPWSMGGSGSMVDLGLSNVSAGASSPGPISRTESPRRFGRSRTDTMVYSEAMTVAEELAKGEGLSGAELDRAIAEERALGASQVVSFPPPAKPSVEDVFSDKEPPSEVHEDEIPIEEPRRDSGPDQSEEDILEIPEPAPTEPHIPFDAEEEEPFSPEEGEFPVAAHDDQDISFSAVEEAEVEAQLGSTPEIRIEAPESGEVVAPKSEPEHQPEKVEDAKEGTDHSEPSKEPTSDDAAPSHASPEAKAQPVDEEKGEEDQQAHADATPASESPADTPASSETVEQKSPPVHTESRDHPDTKPDENLGD